jgi:hypothetical protein
MTARIGDIFLTGTDPSDRTVTLGLYIGGVASAMQQRIVMDDQDPATFAITNYFTLKAGQQLRGRMSANASVTFTFASVAGSMLSILRVA